MTILRVRAPPPGPSIYNTLILLFKWARQVYFLKLINGLVPLAQRAGHSLRPTPSLKESVNLSLVVLENDQIFDVLDYRFLQPKSLIHSRAQSPIQAARSGSTPGIRRATPPSADGLHQGCSISFAPRTSTSAFRDTAQDTRSCRCALSGSGHRRDHTPSERRPARVLRSLGKCPAAPWRPADG